MAQQEIETAVKDKTSAGPDMADTCPIWLVVGFLGAGKTTLLCRLAHTERGRSLVYVINEFSAVDVDAGVIEREGGKTMAVPGGSIFGGCRVNAFIDVLRKVAEGNISNAEPAFRPEGVVIEASSMADPRSMRRLLAENRLDKYYHVAGVIAVVDPGPMMNLLLVLPNIRGQIAAADLILLNKIDLRSAQAVWKMRQKIAAINPHATVLRCQCAAVEPAILLADGVARRTEQIDEAFGTCKDPRCEREVVCFQEPVNLQAVCERISSLGEGLYCAKGFIKTVEGWTHLAWSADVLSLEDAAPGPVSALTLTWNPQTIHRNPGLWIAEAATGAR